MFKLVINMPPRQTENPPTIYTTESQPRGFWDKAKSAAQRVKSFLRRNPNNPAAQFQEMAQGANGAEDQPVINTGGPLDGPAQAYDLPPFMRSPNAASSAEQVVAKPAADQSALAESLRAAQTAVAEPELAAARQQPRAEPPKPLQEAARRTEERRNVVPERAVPPEDAPDWYGEYQEKRAQTTDRVDPETRRKQREAEAKAIGEKPRVPSTEAEVRIQTAKEALKTDLDSMREYAGDQLGKLPLAEYIKAKRSYENEGTDDASVTTEVEQTMDNAANSFVAARLRPDRKEDRTLLNGLGLALTDNERDKINEKFVQKIREMAATQNLSAADRDYIDSWKTFFRENPDLKISLGPGPRKSESRERREAEEEIEHPTRKEAANTPLPPRPVLEGESPDVDVEPLGPRRVERELGWRERMSSRLGGYLRRGAEVVNRARNYLDDAAIALLAAEAASKVGGTAVRFGPAAERTLYNLSQNPEHAAAAFLLGTTGRFTKGYFDRLRDVWKKEETVKAKNLGRIEARLAAVSEGRTEATTTDIAEATARLAPERIRVTLKERFNSIIKSMPEAARSTLREDAIEILGVGGLAVLMEGALFSAAAPDVSTPGPGPEAQNALNLPPGHENFGVDTSGVTGGEVATSYSEPTISVPDTQEGLNSAEPHRVGGSLGTQNPDIAKLESANPPLPENIANIPTEVRLQPGQNPWEISSTYLEQILGKPTTPEEIQRFNEAVQRLDGALARSSGFQVPEWNINAGTNLPLATELPGQTPTTEGFVLKFDDNVKQLIAEIAAGR